MKKNTSSAAVEDHSLFLSLHSFPLHQLPWLTTTWSEIWNQKWRIFSARNFLLLETSFAFSELWASASNVFTMADWLGTITSVPESCQTTIVLAFGNADLAKTKDEASKILLDHCPCGTEERMEPMFTFTHYDGYLFHFGHGRNKCSQRKCLAQPDARLPSNCAFHDQWCWPTDFSHCSLQCKGAFCSCLDNYPSQHGDYF